MVCTLRLLSVVSALIPTASNPFVEVISYEDGEIERSLAGLSCTSSADVQCVLAETTDATGSGIPCVGNLKVRKSDCRGSAYSIQQPVEIVWKYCNTDTDLQDVYQDKTEAFFRSTEKRDNTTTLPSGTCKTLTSKPSINLCKRGATMRVKYKGTVPSRPSSSCYAFDFLRASTKILPERNCVVSTEVTCLINDGGNNQGKQCAGNIINDLSCGDVPVQFLYKICVFNKDANKLKINPRRSKALLNGKDVAFDTTDKMTRKACRRDVVPTVIDSCSRSETIAKLILRGTLNTGVRCSSYDFLKIRVDNICDYKFIITELVADGGSSYIELYSPNCQRRVVSEEFQIIKYNKGQANPSADSPINLKGLETDDAGFIVLCASYRVEKPYDIKRGDICADVNPITAKLTGKETIALISGSVNGNHEILDIFRDIPATDNGNDDSPKGRVVRKCDSVAQTPDFVRGNWDFDIQLPDDDIADPAYWCKPYDIDNLNFGHFEGDIIASYDDIRAKFGEEAANNIERDGLLPDRDQSSSALRGGKMYRGGATATIQLWTYKKLYFYWGWVGHAEDDARESFDEAATLIRTKVGIQFIELLDIPSEQSTNYTFVHRGKGCSSNVGMKGGMQRLSLADGCLTTATATHELVHALGMWHEQSMYNRDDFVEIIFENIPDNKEHNFNIELDTTYLGLNYDYESIMHYFPNAFGIDGKQTIRAVGNHYGASNAENEAKMGERDELTDSDAVQLQLMYHCPSGPRNVMDLCSPECPCYEGQGHCTIADDCIDNMTCQKPSHSLYRHRTHRIIIPDPDFKVCVVGSCDCDYAPGGCEISQVPPPNWACRCEYEGAWTCRGYIDYCADDEDEKCKSPDKSIQSCAQGGGDCGGYDESEGDCDCDYHSGGCTISREAPVDLACKCHYKGAWTCGGETQLCLDPNNANCKNPDKSIQSCAQGGGDCGGYSESEGDCDCDYHSGGCSISREAPVGLACECQYKGAWTCGGETQLCLDPNNANCKNPDKSIQSCAQGGGDCGGYSEANGDCDCDYSSGGCKISTTPINNLACQCQYKGAWTCGGQVVRCRDQQSIYCKYPAADYQTCLQGGGDCGGY